MEKRAQNKTERSAMAPNKSGKNGTVNNNINNNNNNINIVNGSGAGHSKEKKPQKQIKVKKPKNRDSDCCSINFIKYVLIIIDVIFFVSIFRFTPTLKLILFDTIKFLPRCRKKFLFKLNRIVLCHSFGSDHDNKLIWFQNWVSSLKKWTLVFCSCLKKNLRHVNEIILTSSSSFRAINYIWIVFRLAFLIDCQHP